MTTDLMLIRRDPMSPQVAVMDIPFGVSIGELLRRAVAAGRLAPADLPYVEVYVDGERLARTRESLAVVPPPQVYVNCVVRPQGGGHKNPLEAILDIALIVLSAWVGAPGGPLAFLGKGVAAGIVRAAAATVVLGVGNALLQNQFAPRGGQSNDHFSLEGQTNQARPREPLPLVSGRRRVVFDLCASAYSSTVGDDTYIHAVYCAHDGPANITDLKIGETLLASLEAGEVEVDIFDRPGPRASDLYPMRDIQETYASELDHESSDWTTHTTQTDTEVLEMDFYCPVLFYKEDDDADLFITLQYQPADLSSGFQPITGFLVNGAAAPTHDRHDNALSPGVLFITGKTHDPVRVTVRWTPPSKGQWNVRANRQPRPDSKANDAVSWTALRTIENIPPVLNQHATIIFAKFKGSPDINGTAAAFSGVVEPVVPVWDALTETWSATADDWAGSSNAAAFARWMLTDADVAAKPLDPAEVDASLGDQYQLIEDNGFSGAVLMAESSLMQDEALARLGQCGRFKTFWTGQKLACVADWTRQVPRQVFGGRNAQGYRKTRRFPDPVHAIDVEFDNLDDDSRSDTITVYAAGYDRLSATLYETITLKFACTKERAWREGNTYLAKRAGQQTTHEWTAGVDSIVTTLGDRALVKHFSALKGLTQARVMHRIWSGALVAGVRLDTAVQMHAVNSYGLDCRSANGAALRGLQVVTVEGRFRELTFATPLAVEDAPKKGDLIAFGELGEISEDVEIVDVSPSTGGQAKLTALAYFGDDIAVAYTADPPGDLSGGNSGRDPAPVPIILGTSISIAGITVAFHVKNQRTSPLKGFEAIWRYTPVDGQVKPGWRRLPALPPTAREVKLPSFFDQAGVAVDTTVDIEIRSVMLNGEVSEPGSVTGVPIAEVIAPPDNFAVTAEVVVSRHGALKPELHVSADPVTAGKKQDLVVEIRATDGGWDPDNPDDGFVSAGRHLKARNPVGVYSNGVELATDYDLRAQWRTADNLFSAWVYTADPVSVPDHVFAGDAPPAMNLGARGRLTLTANKDGAGATVAGDVRLDGNRVAVPGANKVKFTQTQVETALAPAGGLVGVFWLAIGGADASARFSGWASATDGPVFVFGYDATTDAYTAYDSAANAYAFTPAADDCILARLTRKAAGSTGIDDFASYVVETKAAKIAAPTGLALAQKLSKQSDGSTSVKVVATCDAVTASDFGRYAFEFTVTPAGGSAEDPEVRTHKTPRASLPAIVGDGFSVRVAAVDEDGNYGDYGLPQTLTVAGDSTDPGAVTVVQAPTAKAKKVVAKVTAPNSKNVGAIAFYVKVNGGAEQLVEIIACRKGQTVTLKDEGVNPAYATGNSLAYTASSVNGDGVIAATRTSLGSAVTWLAGSADIEPGGITPSKMGAVTNDQKCLDPYFQDFANYWSITNGTPVQVSGTTDTAAMSVPSAISFPAANASTRFQIVQAAKQATNNLVAVESGTNYKCSFVSRVLTGFNGVVRAQINFLKADGVTACSPSNTSLSDVSYWSSPAGSNINVTVTGQISTPSDCAYVQILLIGDWGSNIGGLAGGGAFISNYRMVTKKGTNDLNDAAVTSAKLGTGSVDLAGSVVTGQTPPSRIGSVASDQKCLDPYFKDFANYWVITNGAPVQVSGTTDTAAMSVPSAISFPAANASTRFQIVQANKPAASNLIQVEAGTNYKCSFVSRVLTGFNGVVRAQINFLKADGVTACSPSNTSLSDDSYWSSPAGSNINASVTGQISTPSDCAYVQILLIGDWGSNIGGLAGGGAFISNYRMVTKKGATDLNDGAVGTNHVSSTAPSAPSGAPTATNVVHYGDDGGEKVDISISWLTAADPNVVGYQLEIDDGVGLIDVPCRTNVYRIRGVKIGTTYKFRLRYANIVGRLSGYSPQATLVAAGDGVAPGSITGGSATAVKKGVKLAWTDPADADLDRVEIRRNTANTLTGAVVVNPNGKRGKWIDHEPVDTTQAYYYWGRTYDRSGNTNGTDTAIGNTAPAAMSTTDLDDTKRCSRLDPADLTDVTVITASLPSPHVQWGVGASAPYYLTYLSSGATVNFDLTTGGPFLTPTTGDTIILGNDPSSQANATFTGGVVTTALPGQMRWITYNATSGHMEPTYCVPLLSSSGQLREDQLPSSYTTLKTFGGFLSLGNPTALTIASDTVAAANSSISVDTESAAATDNLSTINGGSAGCILVVKSVSSARVVTVKDGIGNLHLAGDMVLDNPDDRLVLINQGSAWYELCRSNNA